MRDSMTKNFQKIEREEAARAQQHITHWRRLIK